MLEVARDVLGGRFAINGGGLPGTPGGTYYFAPDTLTWDSLGLGHGAFVAWALSDGPADFYRDLRWAGWEAEVEAIPLGEALSVYPPLFSAESAGGEVSRRPVPWHELAAFHEEMGRQLAALPEGAKFQLKVSD